MPRNKYIGKKNKARSESYDKQKDENGWYKFTPYEITQKENKLFEKYYRQLNICATKEEFDEMLQILKKPLPITFRITSYKSFSKEILDILKSKHFKYLDEICKEDNGELVASAIQKQSTLLKSDETKLPCEIGENGQIYECLKWYPNEMAWKVLLSKADVRKNTHFEEFKSFLVHQTENGNLNRQEAVSMIPPLCLDIKSHHKILDMCASPGSKTAQLIEFLHADKSNPTPEGFVIANDLDNKRCYMLMHQLKRLESPNFMIVNHDASCIPNMRGNDGKNIMYDRILADVPCSGDGTFRKNIDVWTKWNFAQAGNLHGIQLRIANRASELLKPGGLMVYSTCSMNPVENEAVVSNLLLKFPQLELVDVRDKLPTLKTQPGLYTWNVMSKAGEIYNTVEEVQSDQRSINLLRPGMFPPELEVAKRLGLEKCMRVLPHYQNTGGFFVAVIRKKEVEPIDVQRVVEPKVATNAMAIEETVESNQEEEEMTNETCENDYTPPEADESRMMKAPPAKKVKHMFEENPFKFIDNNEVLMNDWPKIKDFFNISEEFPKEQMMTRNKVGENVRTIYFVSKQIRELVINNGDRIKFINMGVPLLSRADLKDPSSVQMRVCQESLDIVHKYFNCRTVYLRNRDDLIKLLTESCPLQADFSEEFQIHIKENSQLQNGSLVIIYQHSNQTSEGIFQPINFTAWLGKVSLRPFLKADVRRFFLTILGLDQKFIEEAIAKVKLEDDTNAKKSELKNPHSKNYTGLKPASGTEAAEKAGEKLEDEEEIEKADEN